MPVRAEFDVIFREEGQRHLDDARRVLTSLAQAGPAKEGLSALYRHLHSVKGMAATLGLDAMVRAAHEVEDLVEGARKGEIEIDDSFIARLHAGLETLSDEIASRSDMRARRSPGGGGGGGLALRLPPARIAAGHLDELVRLATTLASSHQRLEHQLGPPEDGSALRVRHRLVSAVRGLTRELLELRLVPVSTLEPLLRSAVTRWSETAGVLADLRLEGEDVHVERGLVEKLFDPLGQLVRNALVHGIEDPESREAAGKAPRGRVEIAFSRRSGRLVVTVRDDGRGLDPEAVLRRARHRGLLARGAEPGASQDRLLLLTDPAMGSGAADPDELKGRGVGLAAARAAIEELGGRIALESARGAGFSARFSLPSRRALQEAFIVRAGGRTFAIPLAPVRAVRRVDELSEGGTVPRVPLSRILGLECSGEADQHALVIEVSGHEEALVVDKVVERRELLVESLGPPLDTMPPWGGAAPLAEGGLVLVVDPWLALGRSPDEEPSLLHPAAGRE